MYLVDYHTHSHISFDAVDTLYEIAQGATEKGLDEFCITEHCEANADEVTAHPYDYEKSYNEFIKTQRLFDKIKIKFGVEIGQATQNIPYAKEILAKPFDFILGSLHSMKNTLDFCYTDYKTIDVDEYLKRYYREVLELVEFKGFDSLAHLTYPFRYAIMQKIPVDIDKYMPLIKEVLAALVKNNIGLEVNTSGLRQQTNIFMPGYDIVKAYYDMGGKIVTVGSDSHDKTNIGSNIKDAYEMILSCGFKYVATFEKRQVDFVKIQL